MTMHRINWDRLGFIQLVNNVLGVLTFMVSVSLAILFGWIWFFIGFLGISTIIAIGYRVAFNFSTCYAYYLWIRYNRSHMTEYVARQMGVVENVEIPDTFPSGVAAMLGLTNASLAEARSVNVGLHA